MFNKAFLDALRIEFAVTHGYNPMKKDITANEKKEIQDFGTMYLMGPLHLKGF